MGTVNILVNGARKDWTNHVRPCKQILKIHKKIVKRIDRTVSLESYYSCPPSTRKSFFFILAIVPDKFLLSPNLL